MIWPAVDHLWRHESYQAPLLSDRISDLISSRKTRRRGKDKPIKTYIKHIQTYIKHIKKLYKRIKTYIKRITTYIKLIKNTIFREFDRARSSTER